MNAVDMAHVRVIERGRRLGSSDQTGFDVLLAERLAREEFQCGRALRSRSSALYTSSIAPWASVSRTL